MTEAHSGRPSHLAIRIQHWPKRPQGLQRLLDRTPSAEVIVDFPEGKPNPWRGYKKCLSNLPATGHVVVLQDDTVPCINFEPALERVIAARPNDLISLFVGGLVTPTRTNYYNALKWGLPWCQIYFRDIHHVCALVWPVEIANSFMVWTETAKIPGHDRFPRSDDAIVGSWARQKKMTVWATVPSLVEHPDDVFSTIGRRNSNGKDKGRVAIQWIGDADPLDIDWSVV
jgi:hypothetical protein